MSILTLKRKSNFILMGRKFKIYINDNLFDSISDGEIKKIDIPSNSKELTVKVMNYKSKPIVLNSLESETYVIRQNLIATLATYIGGLCVVIFFLSKFVLEQEQRIFFYISTPFLLVSIYYSTIGRRSVIQLKKITDVVNLKVQ